MAKVIRSDAAKSEPDTNKVIRSLMMSQVHKLMSAVVVPHIGLKTGKLDPIYIVDWSDFNYPVLRVFANANPPAGDKPVMITQRALFAQSQAWGYIEYAEGDSIGEYKLFRKMKESRALYCGTLMLEVSMGGPGWNDPRMSEEVVKRGFAQYRRIIAREQRAIKKATKPKGNGDGI